MEANAESSIPIDALVRHAAGIRRLFERALDPAFDADDVSQASFLKAWSASTDARHAHSSWWRLVARHLTRDANRAHARRTRREERAARAEAQSSSADIIVRAETHRRLVERVLELDEPYRRVVLLHYFDDLELRAIAQVTQQAEGTVRSQLHRGLRLLRERLQRDESFRGDARMALALPLPMGASSIGIGGISGGAAIMSTGMKCAIALALVVATAWVVWPEKQPTENVVNSAPPVVSSMEAAPTNGSATQVRSAAADTDAFASAAMTSPPDDLGLLFYGQLISSSGAANWSELRCSVVLEDESSERSWIATDDRGGFACYDLQPGRYQALVTAQNHRPLHTTLEIAASPSVQKVVFHLETLPSIPVHLTDLEGRSVEERAIFGKSHNIELSVAVSKQPFPAALPSTPFHGITKTEGGIFRHERGSEGQIGIVDIHAPFPVYVALLRRNAVIAERFLEAAPERLEFALDSASVASKQSSLRANVVGRGSRPALEQFRWEFGHAQGARLPGAPVPAGELRIDDLNAGQGYLRLSAEGFESLSLTLALEPGKELDLGRIELQPERIVRGRVLDESGQGRAAKMFVFDLERDWIREMNAGRQERSMNWGFAMRGLGERSYGVCVEIAGYGRQAFSLDLRSAPVGDQVWTVPRGRELRLRIGEGASTAWTFVLFDNRGLPVEHLQEQTVRDWPLLLSPGAYRALYRVSGEETQSFDLQVWDGENELVHIP